MPVKWHADWMPAFAGMTGKKMSEQNQAEFDPNAAALSDAGIFGLPFTYEEAALVYLPVPWEVTTSYGGGTSSAPAAILQASHQTDLFDLDVVRPWAAGLHMLPASPEIQALNIKAKISATRIIEGEVTDGNKALTDALDEVNRASEKLNQYVYAETRRLIKDSKIPAIVGGDHSVPFGAFRAVAETYPSFGILHFDAHSDTREAYEGFTFSHASIMYNALEAIPQISHIVQVGIRDVCEAEYDYIHGPQKHRVTAHFDQHLQQQKLEGTAFSDAVQSVLLPLPQHVWISFDIDGLDPRFCPHTGTPVPGGLTLDEACYLVRALVRSGRTIIGFDLNEVAPDPLGQNEWDANVAARLLYKLSAFTLLSQNKAHPQTKMDKK